VLTGALRLRHLVLVGVLGLYAVALGRTTSNGMFDFRIFRAAGAAVLAGRSPWSVHGFIYPPPAAVAFVPFAALPFSVSTVAFALVATAALGAALWVLEVRDWRCYAAVFISFPAMTSISTGTLSGVVALAAALVWRFRDRLWVASAALGAAIGLKIVLWPLLVWLVVTKRIRTAAASVGMTGLFVGIAFAIVGSWTMGSLEESAQAALQTGRSSYSVYALLRAMGLSRGPANVLPIVAGGVLLLASIRARDERHSFTIAVAAALVATPVIWIHYLVLLFVPIAIYRPRLSLVWWLPSVFLVFGDRDGAYGSISRIGLVLATSAAIILAAAVTPRAKSQLVAGLRQRAGRVVAPLPSAVGEQPPTGHRL
jgi:alpha-1,2-mannosyltransferase